jgi:LysR family transcriptional regulator, regulator for bpeEF and oprC
MDLNRALMFAKVVENGSFTAAARRLGSPKSTVSKKVADLEAELGVRLLNRTTRSLKLTEAGQRLYEHCLDALQRLEDGERLVRELQRSPSGMLTVGGPAAICVNFLMPTILEFAELYPKVQLTLVSVNDFVEPSRDDIDILIWVGETPPVGHSMRLVADIDLGLYGSYEYLERFGHPKEPSELANHAAVAFVQSFKSGRFAWRLTREGVGVEVAPLLPPRLRFDDPGAIMRAVAAGHGIGMLPLRFASLPGAAPNLTPVLPAWRGAPIAVRALVVDTGNLKSRLFLDFVARWFREA